MGPCAGDDYNLTLCQLQQIYHGQPYATVDLNRMPESALSSSRELWIWSLLRYEQINLYRPIVNYRVGERMRRFCMFMYVFISKKRGRLGFA
jgi:hypothetical protein